MDLPHLESETECLKRGYCFIAGVDEVGRGCLAGPVVAAAVILSADKVPKGINDSKKLSAKQRETLDLAIRETAVAFAIGVGDVLEIDTINILQSSKRAMLRAVAALKPKADFLLLDGNFKIDSRLPQKCIIGGDRISVSIAAASIIAKVYRDALMREMDTKYPGYCFAQNKGYGSIEHRRALEALGPTEIHRKSFSWTPVREIGETLLQEETL